MALFYVGFSFEILLSLGPNCGKESGRGLLHQLKLLVELPSYSRHKFSPIAEPNLAIGIQ